MLRGNTLSFLQGTLLDEQTGCLLKFSGELEDVSREDFHDVFSGHGKIKWVDFTRGAKEVQKTAHYLCISFFSVVLKMVCFR